RRGARLPNEPLSQFLERLSPAEAAQTTPAHLLPPWYWIDNPHRNTADGESGDMAAFLRDGRELLRRFKLARALCTPNDPRRKQLREGLKEDIAALARRCGVTTGKWMLFPKVDEVNEVWRKVCEGVDADRLGIGAKVSTSGEEDGDPTRLICVYTKDFTDVEDVKRVLLSLVDMGLVRADMPRGIMYKCDAYTYLEIYGKNEYGLRPSIYGSKEMLAG
ncbi:uncharacterized protein THITE_14793, partial [Thermothielavioides terrestris NRRL 8126]